MKVNKKYIVVQTGCIERGVSSYPIGIYDTLEEARKAREAHPSTWNSEGRDGYVKILPINEDSTSRSVE